MRKTLTRTRMESAMKRIPGIAAALFLATSLLIAQTPPPAGSAPASGAPPAQKSIAATMNVYVFPNGGQDTAAQSKDEGECYNWAVQNTSTDPFQLQKQAQAQQQKTEQQKQQIAQAGGGAGVKGAVGGAAAG